MRDNVRHGPRTIGASPTREDNVIRWGYSKAHVADKVILQMISAALLDDAAKESARHLVSLLCFNKLLSKSSWQRQWNDLSPPSSRRRFINGR